MLLHIWNIRNPEVHTGWSYGSISAVQQQEIKAKQLAQQISSA